MELIIRIVEQVPCGKGSAYLIDNTDLFSFLRERYRLVPLSFEKVNEESLQQLSRCLFTLQLTNSHYFLLLTNIQGVNCCIMMNRSERVCHLLECAFSAELFADTIIAGEACGKYFLCEDLIVYRGQGDFYRKHDLHQRRAALRKIFEQDFKADALMDPYTFVEKPYLALDSITRLKQLNQIVGEYGVSKFRSIVFTPTTFGRFPTSLLYHMDHTELRPNNQRMTVDPTQCHNFLLVRDDALPDVYTCMINIDGKRYDLGHALISSKEESLNIQQLDSSEAMVFRCVFDRFHKKWRPVQYMKGETSPDSVTS